MFQSLQGSSLNSATPDFDRRSVKRAMEIFSEEFEQAGIGKVRLELDHGSPAIWTPSIHHPMGTTRMHENPKHGVVDANCRVHGVSNLFIASSSVFPTGGYANPTLTLLALAIRVADQVKTVMQHPRHQVLHRKENSR
jgi:choline dehydrogenase-like flavoprotein